MILHPDLFNPRISLTERIPIGTGEYLTPVYEDALRTAGVYPWHWDIRENRILMTPGILDLMPRADKEELRLDQLLSEHLDAEALQNFYSILNAFIREESPTDCDFRLKRPQDGTAWWMRISGRLLKNENGIEGALGHVRNISDSVSLRTAVEETEDFLDTLINLIPLPIYYKNTKGQYKFFNRAFADLNRLKDDEIRGKTASDLYDREQAEDIMANDTNLINKKGLSVFEKTLTFRDGRTRDFMVRKTPDISRKRGVVKGLAGFMIDITDENRASRRISRLMEIKELVLEINHAILSIPDLESLLEFILNKIPQVIRGADCGAILLNDDGMVTMTASFGYVVNEEDRFSFPVTQSFMYREGEGLPDAAVIINDLQEVVSGGDYPALLPTLAGETVRSSMSSPILRDGKVLGLFTLDSFRNRIFNEEDIEVMEYLIEQLAVILDKQELYQRVLGLSRFDSLTGLSNRHYFKELAQSAINRAGRTDQSLIVVLVDLDSLKAVNDFWGHEAGDAMITSFSRRLKESFRDSDILGRIGGDEFTGVFHDTGLKDLEVRFRALIDTPPLFSVSDGTVACRFSYGMAEYPGESESLDELIRIADSRMYKMKIGKKGGNAVVSKENLLMK